MIFRTMRRGLWLAGLALAASPAVAQQTPEQFYKDKVVRVLVGHPPGGSYDFYARLMADALKENLPGLLMRCELRPGWARCVFFCRRVPAARCS